MWRHPQPRRAPAGALLGLSSPRPERALRRTRSHLRQRLRSLRLSQHLPRQPLRRGLKTVPRLQWQRHQVSYLQLTF